MRNGRRRNVIEIHRQVQIGFAGINEPNYVWQKWREIFAEVETRRGKEFLVDNQRRSEVVWRFTTRYEEVVGLDASMKIVHDGMDFDIKSPIPDGQYHRDCVIECTLQRGYIGSEIFTIYLAQNVAAGSVGSAYSGLTPSVEGGVSPYTFSIASGTLPADLSINSDTGEISGTPTAAGTSAFVIRVTDSEGDVADLPQIEITVT